MRARSSARLILFAVAFALPAVSHAQGGGTVASANLIRAMALEDSGRYEDAAVLFLRALSTDTVEALLGLERVYESMGQRDRILAIVDRLVRVMPRDRTVRTVQLRSLRAVNRGWAVRVAVEQWMRAAPDDPEAYREYVRAVPPTPESLRNAWEILKRLSASDSAAVAWAELASVAMTVEVWDVARAVLIKTWEYEKSPEVSEQLALVAARMGDLTRAKEAASHANLPPNAEARGWIALYEGDLKTARSLLKRSDASSPGAVVARAFLSRTRADTAPAASAALLSLARGDSSEAAAGLVGAASQSEAPSFLILLAARIYARQKNENKAFPLWERVMKEFPASPEAPEGTLEVGRTLARKGDIPGAIAQLERLILTYPASALVPQARRELDLLKKQGSSST
jgi:tetratricopeptide (TPR) repeat protein